MNGSKGIWRMVLVLAAVGGLAFWLVNFAISRTPIAAEYRAALSISYFPMLIEALIGGFGCFLNLLLSLNKYQRESYFLHFICIA